MMGHINEEVRYLGWKEPFASLMLCGKIETRTWPTKYRGLVLITASKTFYNENQVMDIAGINNATRCFVTLNEKGIKEQKGMAIAVGRLVDCRLMTKEDEEKCFVEYREPWFEERTSKNTGIIKTVQMKLYCHVYEDVKAIIPFELKGAQGWRKLTEDVITQIEYL